ncbi:MULTISPECIES: enoyl-CoA hydratase-related protein [Sulfurimonas]|uniref:enoyl-CoA hydratase-related protein n=1 Tax=Sulfurimonas TaxID=202746 RepID=UPI001264F1EE|nr:enoyl-CoA hydratase-related protein [Sulfurimonas indica]
MKITLLISTFNSTSQLTYTYLKNIGHIIDVVYAINDTQMIEEIKAFEPELILCPFLKKFVPSEIYTNFPTYILHPGIRGDKGAYSLDNALREAKSEWGVVYLRANDEFDGGSIYAEEDFMMRYTYKASLYRNEVNVASLTLLKELLTNIEDDTFTPTPQLPTPPHKQLTQADRAIDWQRDTTQEILTKIYMSDSHPGVLDEILGLQCYLYGAWKEERLRGEKPKEILAKRDGAICLSTVDGAIWVTHLKEVGKFKLPATYVLKERLKGIKEERLPLIFDKSYKTFYEINCEIKDEIAYLYFNFHNGAFSSDKCMKLKYAFEYIKEQVKVVVLMGGVDFFSNGIHLNILEDSKKNGEDGWSNINAMNDLVKSILFADDVVTVASLEKNAGAGGVFLALACDYVVACEGVVLNPHYKTLGLSGSEYHTYSLPKRVGEQKAEELLDACLPIGVNEAQRIGMVERVFSHASYQKELEVFCKVLLEDEDAFEDFLWEKEDYLEANREIIEAKREAEIAVMHPEFWDNTSSFHTLRYEFVYKVCPSQTPKRLKAIINE